MAIVFYHCSMQHLSFVLPKSVPYQMNYLFQNSQSQHKFYEVKLSHTQYEEFWTRVRWEDKCPQIRSGEEVRNE